MTDEVTDAICFDMVVSQRDAARRRIEKLEAALHNVTTSWDLWQKANDSKSFTELFACICEAKALEGNNE